MTIVGRNIARLKHYPARSLISASADETLDSGTAENEGLGRASKFRMELFVCMIGDSIWMSWGQKFADKGQ